MQTVGVRSWRFIGIGVVLVAVYALLEMWIEPKLVADGYMVAKKALTEPYVAILPYAPIVIDAAILVLGGIGTCGAKIVGALRGAKT